MEKSQIIGRSLPLNVLAIVINLTGLTFLVLGYHDNFEEKAMLFKSLGYGGIAFSVVLFILFKGFNMMSYVSRVIIGGLFIVSGLIKANDPLGFSYKLEEYFEDGALAYRLKEMGWESFSLEGFMDYALIISIVVCIAEIVLGVAVIIGSRMKLAFWSLLIMMGFFTILTWHTKSCDPDHTYVQTEVYSNDASKSDDVAALQMYQDRIDNGDNAVKIENLGNNSKVFITKPVQCVNDCGCFGDALKGSVGRSLTPQESYWKDIVLLYLVIFVGIAMGNIQNNTLKENVVLVPLSLLVVGFFSWVFGWYFPIIFALIVILVPLMMKRMQSKSLNNDLSRSLFVVVACVFFVGYVLLYLPVKDYRPYAIGQNIPENMISKKDPIYESISVYENKKDGSIKEFSMSDSMMYAKDGVETKVPVWQVIMDFDKDNWAWKDSKNKEVDPGIPATILDFQFKKPLSLVSQDVLSHPAVVQSMEETKDQFFNTYYILIPKDTLAYTDSVLVSDFDPSYYPDSTYTKQGPVDVPNGSDAEVNLLPYLFAQEKQLFIVMKKLYKKEEGSGFLNSVKNAVQISAVNYPSKSEIEDLKSFLNELDESYNVLIFCAESQENIDKFKKEHGMEKFDFTNAVDDKELKVVNRATPGIVAVNKGIVKGKWSINNRPLKDELEKTLNK